MTYKEKNEIEVTLESFILSDSRESKSKLIEKMSKEL